ncbi:MAG: NUDIX domain-containing protein [Candidatus Limnocylindria bacterium]
MDERTLRSDRVFEGRLLKVRVDDVMMADGRPAQREIVEHPGAVAILAWDGARLAAVRQWRQAAARETLELPAGTRDPGEEPRRTAERELAEECGLAATAWEPGPGFWTAPGFCTEFLTLWLATDLHPVTAAGPPDEALEVTWLTLDQALTGVAEGAISDAKSMVGIYWLARRLRMPGPPGE